MFIRAIRHCRLSRIPMVVDIWSLNTSTFSPFVGIVLNWGNVWLSKANVLCSQYLHSWSTYNCYLVAFRLHIHNQQLIEKSVKMTQTITKQSDTVEPVKQFGFAVPTCCGYIPQDNTWNDDWISFFARQRLDLQIQRLLTSVRCDVLWWTNSFSLLLVTGCRVEIENWTNSGVNCNWSWTNSSRMPAKSLQPYYMGICGVEMPEKLKKNQV